jgi:hypothetical protein
MSGCPRQTALTSTGDMLAQASFRSFRRADTGSRIRRDL